MARFSTATSVVILVALFVGFAWSQVESPPTDPSPAAADPEREAFVKTAAVFDGAYNSHDAEAVAGMFSEQGEMNIDGGTISGREAIREAFATHFAEYPESSIRTEIDAVRFPSPSMAIEEGRTYASLAADEPPVERRYVIVHVRNGDKWAIASVREESSEPLTPAQALEPLAWLVGDWVDESDDAVVETSCRWSDDGNWLLQDYRINLHGGPEMTGTQRIGWDASREQVRSWAFDSLGGFIEGTWEYDGESWTAQLHGVSADGAVGSGTRVITTLGPDAFLLQSFHRVFDGEALPDSEVTVVRQPPLIDTESPETESTDTATPADAPTTPTSN